MRKVYEIVMVIAAAGLAAAVALIDIPTHSADPGTVIGGEGLFAAPPPMIGPSFPPLPLLLAPPGSSTPVPTDPAATPTSPLRVQPQGVTEAASAVVGVLGTASVPRPPTATTDPPAAKPKAKPAAKAKPTKAKPKPPPPKAKPVKAKPKPPPPKAEPVKAKPQPPPPKAKAKGGTKPEDRRKSASTGSSSRSRPGG
jgi:histone H1/5